MQKQMKNQVQDKDRAENLEYGEELKLTQEKDISSDSCKMIFSTLVLLCI